MFNKTKVKLELVADPDMHIFFWKVTRSGIFFIFKRCSKSNNKGLEFYDLKQESKHITYLGTNNLYGYAMFKSLPRSGFKWIDPKEFHLNKYIGNSSKLCVLEVEIETEIKR